MDGTLDYVSRLQERRSAGRSKNNDPTQPPNKFSRNRVRESSAVRQMIRSAEGGAGAPVTAASSFSWRSSARLISAFRAPASSDEDEGFLSPPTSGSRGALAPAPAPAPAAGCARPAAIAACRACRSSAAAFASSFARSRIRATSRLITLPNEMTTYLFKI